MRLIHAPQILFGSITEEDLRSVQSKPSGNSKIPFCTEELQFGSLSLVSGALLSGGNGEIGKKLTSVKSSDSVKKDDGSPHLKNTVLGSGIVAKENGSIHSSEHVHPLANGVKQVKDESPDLASASLTKSGGTVSSQQFSSPPQVGQDIKLKERYSNGVHDASQKFVPLKDDLKKGSNGSVASTSDLLPRGLINPGNLCFLNATLQALLSCSPFLKLLQELRTRDIPKV